MASWIEEEIAGSKFKDKRLSDSFHTILETLSAGDGRTIPQLCEDWTSTKALYRFLSNEKVEESEILNGHFEQTSKRISAAKGPVLVLHDTCEFSYKRDDPDAIGYTRTGQVLSKIKSPKKQEYKVCGVLMHASLAVTSEGLPLGLTSARYWSRKVFKNTRQMKRLINPTRVPIEEKESIKWLKNIRASNESIKEDASKFIHIRDREADIFELFTECDSANAYFLMRSCVNRLADESTIVEILSEHKNDYLHRIEFVDGRGILNSATLQVKVKAVNLHPPHAKAGKYPDVSVHLLSAVELNPPEGRDPIKWTFVTNLPIESKTQAIQALEWYKQRWKIELYFKIIKSGFRAEESKLRTADRITRLLSIFCILAWRVHWITFLQREAEEISPMVAFDKVELKIIGSYFSKSHYKSLQEVIRDLARLGGHLGRQTDSPPGNIVIWRGLGRLQDLRRGFELSCG